MSSITLNSAATSHRDWKTQFQFNDSETGSLIDFTGALISIAMEDQEGCQKFEATTGNGMIVIVSTGIFEMTIPAATMALCAGSYNIGGYYVLNGATIDLFEGSLSLRRGIPRP